MGFIDGAGPEGLPAFTNTPQTTADFNEVRDLIVKRGNSRKGTAAEMNALVAPEAFDGLTFYATDIGRTFIYQGGWVPLTTRVLGSTIVTGPTIVAASPSWTDVMSLTATSHGGVCEVDWCAVAYNSASGATRLVSFRVLLDGSAIGPTLSFDVTTSAGIGQLQSFFVSSTPAAGSHTWKLQMNCSAAPACGFKNSTLKVTER